MDRTHIQRIVDSWKHSIIRHYRPAGLVQRQIFTVLLNLGIFRADVKKGMVDSQRAFIKIVYLVFCLFDV